MGKPLQNQRILGMSGLHPCPPPALERRQRSSIRVVGIASPMGLYVRHPLRCSATTVLVNILFLLVSMNGQCLRHV